jgi:hypothetical protein
MAKLYADLSCDKGGRISSKGGEEYITIVVKEKNRNMFDITFKSTDYDAYIDILCYSDGTSRRVHYIDPNIPF